MTLKYESELLFDLMKRDGDVAPSDVLPYESVLKEKYLNQVVGAYPKLQDYRPEWLYYNLYGDTPSDFPDGTVANVTSASFYNVVPDGYKSAILKGQTLVNLSENLNTITKSVNSWYSAEKLMDNIEKLKRNTNYTVLYRLENLSGNHEHYNGIEIGIGVTAFDKALPTLNTQSKLDKNRGWCKIKFQLTDDFIEQNPTYKQLHIRPIRRYIAPVEGESIDYTIKGFAILEGDYITNPIPFNEVFEGMQSVKMPVLTTTGKNLFDSSAEIVAGQGIDSDNGLPYNGSQYGHSCSGFLRVKSNTTYTITQSHNKTWIFAYNKNKEYIGVVRTDVLSGWDFITPNDTYYIRLDFDSMDVSEIVNGVQIEEGSTATSYEPYKTNILTVNEDVTLRGIGEVKDELDLLTGELTQRIDTKKLKDITFTFQDDLESETTYLISFGNASHYIGGGAGSKILSNITTTGYIYYVCETEGIRYDGWGLYLRIKKDRITEKTYGAVKQYFESTDATIQYQNKTESIKTVDLSCINEQGESASFKPIEGTMHVNTSSQTLPPLLDMSVPVEATSQNLMSFANIEEEE